MENKVNPDEICNRVMSGRMGFYRARETADAALKIYNDEVDGLINVVQLMKQRILDLDKSEEMQKSINK